MEKLDRLGWAAGLAFQAYGVRVGLRVNRADVLDQLAPHLPPGWIPTASPVVDRLYSVLIGSSGSGLAVRRYSLLYGDVARLVRTMDPAEVFAALERDISQSVAELAPRRVFVHAGAVGLRGQAIVLPGRTFTGKSSLVAALVRAGATYYSDEWTVLDRRGWVHPYPSPIGIREQDDRAPATKLPVEALGGRAGTTPLPVGLVVASRFRAGTRWRPRRLAPGVGVLALLIHTVPAQRDPVRVLTTLRLVVAGAPVLQGPRGEAAEVAPVLLARLQGRSPERAVHPVSVAPGRETPIQSDAY